MNRVNSKLARNGGFTLLELLIAVAIIGVLAAIALPLYQKEVEQTRRSKAEGDLMQLSQWMERRYSTNFDYRDTSGVNPSLPFTTSPHDGSAVFYDISFSGNVTKNTYKLQAKPINGQTGDQCGTLTIDQADNRGADASDCW